MYPRLEAFLQQQPGRLGHEPHQGSAPVAGQQEWLAKRGRVKAFDTLSDRHQSRLAYQDQRHEQKISDEHAARRHGEKEKD
jgi:flagellar export protein FliJ